MHNQVSYTLNYRPTNDLRIDSVVAFVNTFLPTLGMPALIDEDGSYLEPTAESVLDHIKQFNLEYDHKDNWTGCHIIFTTVSTNVNAICRFLFHVGTNSPYGNMIDTFDLTFGIDASLPSVNVMKQAACIGDPFEAYTSVLADYKNYGDNVNRHKKEKWIRPAFIGGFHYLSGELIKNIGGMERCLKTPCYEIKPFQSGVVMRLVENHFDPENNHHLSIQRQAVDHLRLSEPLS